LSDIHKNITIYTHFRKVRK